MSMNYRETEEYSEELSKRGSVLGLRNMEVLMHALSDVQDTLKIVHIAGTNGKGSVASFLSSVLSCGGYKVGVYSSPAVFSPLEIIRIGKKNISRADYASCMSLVREASEKENIPVTLFEAQTAAAFLYFAQKSCDMVILECGLGGAEDATNIIKAPLISVITTVSLDHTQILGKTLEEIASKKAGIIKQGCVCVSSYQDDEVLKVLSKKCSDLSVPLVVADADKDVQIILSDREGSVFKADTPEVIFENIQIKLPGSHQIQNAFTAFLVIRELKKLGYDLTDDTIRKGFKTAVNPGRLEKIHDAPTVIIDGAHNPDGALALREYVNTYFKNKRKIYLTGVFADKDYDTVMRYVLGTGSSEASDPGKQDMVITLHTPFNDRALNSNELAQTVLKYNSCVTAAACVEEAVELAFLSASKKDVIICFGSLSFLGRLKNAVKKITGN